MAITIKPYHDDQWKDVWRVLEPVFRAGETYPYATDITAQQAHHKWVEIPTATYVAHDGTDIVGTFYIKPNQDALGDHVCNCGYVTAENARGKGVASQMCDFSQQEARRLGFSHMQYNLVVASNEAAFRLWKKHGFEHVGTLKHAFRHKKLGLTDAHILYKEL